jgi:hypothetical protein
MLSNKKILMKTLTALSLTPLFMALSCTSTQPIAETPNDDQVQNFSMIEESGGRVS